MGFLGQVMHSAAADVAAFPRDLQTDPAVPKAAAKVALMRVAVPMATPSVIVNV